MRFPWANILLLALIGVELVSGFFGLVSNSPDEAAFILAHRIAGWGIVAVLVWKTANVVRSLRWHRSAAPRTASIVLAIASAGNTGAGFCVVVRRSVFLLVVQRRQLAHLHRRTAAPDTRLALAISYARLPAAILGGQAHIPAIRGFGNCIRGAMARRRSGCERRRAKRRHTAIHRLLRSGQFHRQRISADIVAERQPAPNRRRRLAPEHRRRGGESNEHALR